MSPPNPGRLREQVPDPTRPSAETIEEALQDQRSPTEKKAAADAEVASLRPHAEGERASVAADVNAHQARLRGDGDAGRTQIDVRLQAALAEVERRTADTRGQLHGAADARKNTVRAQVDADAAAARDATEAEVSRAREAIAGRRKGLTDAAEAERARALASADTATGRAVAELEEAAVDCEQAGEHEAGRFAGEEDPAPKQRAAALQVGRESAADIRAKKPSMEPDLRKQAVEHGRSSVDYVHGVLGQLDTAENTLVENLHTAGSQAETAVRDGLNAALAAVDQRLTADLAAVDTTAAAVRDRLTSTATQLKSALAADITTATHEVNAAGNALDQEIDATATETTDLLSEQERPHLPGVLEQTTTARTSMSATASGGRQQLHTAVDGVHERVGASTAAFDAAASTATAQAGDQCCQILSGFSAAVERAAAARQDAAAQALAALRARQQEATSGVLAEVDKACDGARAELSKQGAGYDRTLAEAARRAVEEATRPKTDTVNDRAQEAAEQVDEGFWAGLGRALVKIAVGLVVLVVVALVVAAIAAAFGVLLTAWTAIMIAGAILLTVSLVVALVTRLNQAELAGHPWKAVGIALLDTIGVTGIYEARTGRDIVTNDKLSTADRTERGVLGAVTLVSLFFGARSAIKGPPGGAFVRPVGEVPGWSALGILGRAWAGTKAVAAEIAGAISRGVSSLREWWASRKGATTDADTPSTGGTRPGNRPPPTPGELPPEDIDPSVVKVGELKIVDKPGYLPDGVEAPPGATVVTIEATMPDGRFGWVTHAYNPTTGEFLSLQLILNDVPARTVEVSPGKQVPLTDYLAIRAMRLLNISVSQLRTVRIFDVESIRTVLQIRAGTPVAQTQLAIGGADTVVRAGGRLVSAELAPGTGRQMTLAELLATWEGKQPSPDMVAAHDKVLAEFGLTRAQARDVSVLAKFDILLHLQEATQGVPVPPVVPRVRTI